MDEGKVELTEIGALGSSLKINFIYHTTLLQVAWVLSAPSQRKGLKITDIFSTLRKRTTCYMESSHQSPSTHSASGTRGATMNEKCACSEGAYRSERFRHGTGRSCGRGSWEEAPSPDHSPPPSRHARGEARSKDRSEPVPRTAGVWEEGGTGRGGEQGSGRGVGGAKHRACMGGWAWLTLGAWQEEHK